MSENNSNDNINEILNQLSDNASNKIILSDLITGIHKSLIYSQHNIRNTELNELKKYYDVNVENDENQYTSKTINLDGEDIKESSLTKQNSLTINDVNVNIKINIDKIIERNNKNEIVISKYNEKENGIPTILDFKLNSDINLINISN